MVDIEINWSKAVAANLYQCDRCKEFAVMEAETTGDKRLYGVYCKDHYDTILEDLVEDLQENTEPEEYEDDI